MFEKMTRGDRAYLVFSNPSYMPYTSSCANYGTSRRPSSAAVAHRSIDVGQPVLGACFTVSFGVRTHASDHLTGNVCRRSCLACCKVSSLLEDSASQRRLNFK